MATEIWVNIGSGNGLLPDNTIDQAITLTNIEWSSVKSSDIHIRVISQEMPQPSATEFRLKILYLEFNSNFPGANELLAINRFQCQVNIRTRIKVHISNAT